MLSLLARIHRKGMFQEYLSGEGTPRTSTRAPAKPGFARGTMGATGASPLRTRNPYAAEQKEQQHIQSPIFKAFMSNLAGHK